MGLLGSQKSVLPGGPEGAEDMVSVQYPNMPLPQILLAYEKMTGLTVIQESAIQTATLTIQTNRKMKRVEAAKFIEKSLLLNGYAMVPSDLRTVKVVVVPGKQGEARSEGTPIYSTPKDLPDTDQIVTFVMKFDHLGAEDAAAALGEVFPSHGYGNILPFPQAASVVITDSTSVIRRYLELKEYLDVPSTDLEVMIRKFPLERADAERVVESVTELLELESSKQGSGNASRPTNRPNPGGLAGAAGGELVASVEPQSPDTLAISPKVTADIRSNTVLAIAQKRDMAYIETLVGFLDSPAAMRDLRMRRLNFISVSTFLPIVRDAILPGVEEAGVEGSVRGGEVAANLGGAGAGAANSGGAGGGGGTSSRGRSSGTGGLQAQFGQDVGPESLVIGKTLLIADNLHNTLIASGPEEHMVMIDQLLDEMDRQPKLIQISAVIAQLTLGDDFEFGIDLLRTISSPNKDNTIAGITRNRTGSILDLDTLDDVANFLPAASGLTIYGRINEFSAYVTALESTNRFRVLSRPMIYTLNNRWGKIQSGQRIAVPGRTVSTVDPGNLNQAVASNIDFEEVLLQIEVLPLVNSDNEVTLQIAQRNEDIIGSQNISGNDIPTIGTQQLTTTVIIPDGGTVLLGGLISEDSRNVNTGFPLFTSIPMLRTVFGNTAKENNREELLIFIQPRIISDEKQLAAMEADIKHRTESAEEVLDFARMEPVVEVEPASRSVIPKIFRKKDKRGISTSK